MGYYTDDAAIVLGFNDPDDCDKFVTAYKIKEPEVWENKVTGYWRRSDGRFLIGKYNKPFWDEEVYESVITMLHFAIEHFNSAYRLVSLGDDYDELIDVLNMSDSESDDVTDDLVITASNLDEYVELRRTIVLDERGSII